MMEKTVPAYAKVNLTLDILRRREDGYHDLRMVMQSISLHDVVTVRTETGSGDISVQTVGEDLPAGPGNIAWKAADVFFRETGLRNGGVSVLLEKHIPVSAGMAGGSTDGAAVLRALRDVLCPEMPNTELERLGALVGSDVPFCLRGGTALAEGRGEILTDLPPMPNCWMTVCRPDFGLSTVEMFGRVRAASLTGRPDHAAMEAALVAGDLPAVASQLSNVFSQVLTEGERQAVDCIRTAMLENGALNAVMTGSGPTVFGIFAEETAARAAAEILKASYARTYVAQPI